MVIGVHHDRGADGHPGHIADQRHAAVHAKPGLSAAGRHAEEHQVAGDHAAEYVAEGEEGGAASTAPVVTVSSTTSESRMDT